MGRIIKYAIEMGSGAMIYVLTFIKIGSGIQTLMGEGAHRHTDIKIAWRTRKPSLGE
jgi:hypothetical protein